MIINPDRNRSEATRKPSQKLRQWCDAGYISDSKPKEDTSRTPQIGKIRRNKRATESRCFSESIPERFGGRNLARHAQIKNAGMPKIKVALRQSITHTIIDLFT